MTAILEGADQAALSYSYFVREDEDQIQSRLQGRSVTVSVEYQRIRFPGTPDIQVNPVSDAVRSHSESYRAWKQGRSVGTPLEVLLGKPFFEGTVTQELIDDLRHAGIATVENLASVPDSAARFDAPTTMRKLARDVLAAQAEGAKAETDARKDAEAEDLRARVASLEARLAEVLNGRANNV